MGWKGIIILLLFTTLAFPKISHCEPITGNNFASWSQPSRFNYICGFLDALIAARDSIGSNYLPRNLTYGQAEAVVMKYMSTHPEIWHKNMSIIIVLAINTAFPPPEDDQLIGKKRGRQE